jgi:hypothetical protein
MNRFNEECLFNSGYTNWFEERENTTTVVLNAPRKFEVQHAPPK